ncbi:PAS domain-containing protein [Streptomyces sp. DSM 41972]|uniref:PAS domain-containing protein n=1 Tax=Streptomyces althioticus subsp. attaecolombicae TaxID=3075534 RepID=A0ABU3I0E1_9ACTN|nr:PAS domain-containing protein [Streptomyces sp. DSM 41972]
MHTHAGLGLAEWDTDLRCVWADDVLTRHDGLPRERRLGLPPRAAPAGDADALEETLREVLHTGACAIGRPCRVPVVQGGPQRRGEGGTASVRAEGRRSGGRGPTGRCPAARRRARTAASAYRPSAEATPSAADTPVRRGVRAERETRQVPTAPTGTAMPYPAGSPASSAAVTGAGEPCLRGRRTAAVGPRRLRGRTRAAGTCAPAWAGPWGLPPGTGERFCLARLPG